MLCSVYPSHTWLPWKFEYTSAPNGYWNNLQNQREFMDWLSRELGFVEFEDWYNISKEQIITYGGSGLMDIYRNSPMSALKSVYPEYEWVEWRFNRVPVGFWGNSRKEKEFLEWMGKQLFVNELDDWYRVSMKQIRRVGASTGIRTLGLTSMLQNAYPQHKWDLDKFENRNGPFKASQRLLAAILRKIFDGKGNMICFFCL